MLISDHENCGEIMLNRPDRFKRRCDVEMDSISFLLTDSAFAFACNSRNDVTVSQHTGMTYLAPGKPGDVHSTTAREIAAPGRSGVCDVAKTDLDGLLIAECSGTLMSGNGEQIR